MRHRQFSLGFASLLALLTLPGCGMGSPDPGERMIAIDKSSDQVALLDVASHDPNPWVRREAVGRLRDQTILAKIAGEDPDENVRYAAAGMIQDPGKLSQIAVQDSQRCLDPVWRARGWESHWNRMGLILQLRKMLDDGGIAKRMGFVRIDMVVATETADYSTPHGGADNSSYEGEIVTIRLWQGDKTLATERWRYLFPMNTDAPGMHEHAPVDLQDLIWDLSD